MESHWHWPQLVARSVPELLGLNADPFGALLTGRASAIILREWLPRSKADNVSARLWSLKRQWNRPRGLLPGEHNYSKGAWTRPGGAPNHFILGPDLFSYIGQGGRRGPERFANATARHMRFVADHGLEDVYDALHGGLSALSPRRKVRVARCETTHAPYSPGVFRVNLRGHSLSMHADTLHAYEATSRDGCPYEPPNPLPAAPRSALYPNMYRFQHQLSALLLLRNSDARAARQHSATVHDIHWRSCHYRPSSVSDINVVVDEAHFRQAAGRRRAANLSLGAGDLYVFNSNYVHQVLPVPDPGAGRITLGTFVGIDEKRMHVWA